MASGPIRVFTNKKLSPAITPETAKTQAIKLPPSVSYRAGTFLGEVTATPGTFKAYASGNSDGSQNPTMILQYDTSTDASGNHILSFTNATFEYAGTELSCPAYIAGTFACENLVQSGAGAIDANAVAKMGRLLNGTTALGLLQLI